VAPRAAAKSAEDEAVAAGVERARGPLRLVVALGERPGLHEAGHGDAGDARLRAPGHHHVDLAGPQQPQRPGHRLGAGRARRHRRVHPGPRPELQADPGRGPVRHEHRHGERRDLAQARPLQQVVLVEQGDGAADARADDHGEPLGVDLRRARVGPRLARGDQCHLLAAVQPARLHPRDRLQRRHGQRRGDLHRQVVPGHPLVLVVVDPAHAALAGEQGLPGGRNVAAERSGGPEPGDDDLDGAACRHWFFAM
jgi:hypothetical protein